MARSIAEVLPTVLAHTRERHRQLGELQRRWAGAVGKDMAGHTKVVALRRGVLSVQADDPGSSYTLSLDKPRILKRLNARKGAPTVEDLAIRAGETAADSSTLRLRSGRR